PPSPALLLESGHENSPCRLDRCPVVVVEHITNRALRVHARFCQRVCATLDHLLELRLVRRAQAGAVESDVAARAEFGVSRPAAWKLGRVRHAGLPPWPS